MTTSWSGRLLGLILGGFIFHGPGLIIGLIIGYLYDAGILRRWFYDVTGQKDKGDRSYTQDIFFYTTFSVMGYIAKADGQVTERDIDYARSVMRQLNLDEAAKRRAIEAFNAGKNPDYNLDASLDTLKRACWYKPDLLKFFLESQIHMAQANGTLGVRAQAVITKICQHFGIAASPFSQQHSNYSHYQQSGSDYSSYQQSTYTRPDGLDEAYRLLGILKDATDAEVKKAYRKQMSANHPDRLIAKGVPEEMIKIATQKTQQIKKAYEDICSARGLK
jgi:DnaJ like chaperone protein